MTVGGARHLCRLKMRPGTNIQKMSTRLDLRMVKRHKCRAPPLSVGTAMGPAIDEQSRQSSDSVAQRDWREGSAARPDKEEITAQRFEEHFGQNCNQEG